MLVKIVGIIILILFCLSFYYLGRYIYNLSRLTLSIYKKTWEEEKKKYYPRTWIRLKDLLQIQDSHSGTFDSEYPTYYSVALVNTVRRMFIDKEDNMVLAIHPASLSISNWILMAMYSVDRDPADIYTYGEIRKFWNWFRKFENLLKTNPNFNRKHIISLGYPILLKNGIKMRVFCFSLLEFNSLVMDRGTIISNCDTGYSPTFDLYPVIHPNIAIISIVNKSNENGKDHDWTTIHPLSGVELSPNSRGQLLELKFADDNEDFDVTTAREIIEFIIHNKHYGRDFYVHCVAGKSRSQAVCRFIIDTFPVDYIYGREQENPLKTPNYHILSTLKRVWRFMENEDNEDNQNTV